MRGAPWCFVFGLALLAFGLVRVVALRWVCDDAFISIRYADNLVSGLGLVYNAGERVEGYTNFLFHVWATGGLETMLFTSLAVLAIVLTRAARAVAPGRVLLVG